MSSDSIQYHATSLRCLKLLMRTSRGGTTQVCVTRFFYMSSLNSQSYEIDGDPTQSTPNQPPQPSHEESTFGDSSGPFFSIYSKAAEEEDNRMVERWQKDADGILIFVSRCVVVHAALSINCDHIDRSILRCRCRTPRCDRPGPEAKQPGYVCVLSWEHL